MPRFDDERGRPIAESAGFGHDPNQSLSIVAQHQRAITRLALDLGPRSDQFTLVDYGCGAQKPAIEAVYPAIAALRAFDDKTPLVVRHVDVPENNWCSLVDQIQGPSGYATNTGNLRTELVLKDFYFPCSQPDSVDLATCFAASHWLSDVIATPAPNAFFASSAEEPAFSAFERRAAADWKKFVQLRLDELRPGGRLLVVALAAHDNPTEQGKRCGTGVGPDRAVKATLDAMVAEGLLERRLASAFILPIWFRTLAETLAPFREDPSIAERSEVLEANFLEQPFTNDTEYASAIADPHSYAHENVRAIRGYAHRPLMAKLFTPSTSTHRRAERLASEFYRRLHARYRECRAEDLSKAYYIRLVVARN